MDQAANNKVHLEKAQNFMRQYRDPESRELKKLSANQFMDVWSHYDRDGNGYIEGTELDGFLKEFVSSANATDISPENILPVTVANLHQTAPHLTVMALRSPSLSGFFFNTRSLTDEMLVELKSCFMEAYDDNQDGKIDIREHNDLLHLQTDATGDNDMLLCSADLAQLLPMEENFLLLFRFDNPLESSVEFMKIWREYDSDNSGYIEADELKNFLRDLLKEAKKINDVSEDKLIEYTDTMANDKQITASKRTLFSAGFHQKIKDQTLSDCNVHPETAPNKGRNQPKLTKEDIEKVFSLYDRDNNGSIENEELRGFLKDLLELVKKDYDAQDLIEFEETILRGVGYDKDGKISRKELTMILLALAKLPPDEDQ
ncbi:calbindin-32 [Anopheles darlingi]|uniref:Calbindin-32 n=1 Tax=Anopheles darlingi TaxID=43151 RepID=W5JJ94_ANODA|nr:calbindin-32 [Anopheles darlingi]